MEKGNVIKCCVNNHSLLTKNVKCCVNSHSLLTKCVASAMLLGVVSPSFAEDGDDASVSFEVGADLVSAYVWRGIDCAGMSAQPSATITFNKPGISFGVWASAELFQKNQIANMSEFDLSLTYSPCEKFSIGLTDYNFCGGNYFGNWDFSSESTHNLEANISYDFGPLSLGWNTVLTGPDINEKGKRAYSSYVEAAAPFKIGGVDCSAALGACPWGYHFGAEYGDKFTVINVSLKAEKEIAGIPVFGQVIVNPKEDKTFFVFGASF